MGEEMVLAEKSVAAFIAGEGALVVVVAVNMDGQFAFFFELFGAHGAGVQCRRLVFAPLVPRQRRRRCKVSRAFRTKEWLLARVLESGIHLFCDKCFEALFILTS